MERGGEGGDRRGEFCAGCGDEHDRAAVRAASQPAYGWRRQLRAAAVADGGIPLPDFVPIVAERWADASAATIEIAVGEVVVRAGPGVDLAFLGEIIRLLKATA